MRTAPLWGLRLVDAKHQLLHDGRATSLSDAILRHDGQALTARNAFAALSGTDRNNLLAFLQTLLDRGSRSNRASIFCHGPCV